MRRPIRVLELRSVRGTGGGPEKTILMGAARSDPSRVHVTVCYIRDARDTCFAIDRRAAELGIEYVEIVERNSFDSAVWPALRQLVRERDIDIVHAHEHKTDLLALALSRAERIVPLATAHGWSGRSMKERLYYFFDRQLLARYPMVIAVSEPIRKSIVRHGGHPARVRRLPNGIDHTSYRRTKSPAAARQALPIPPDAFVVGAIGRLERVKRFDVLLNAVARLRLSRTPHVVIAGDGSCRADLERQAQALGLSDRVHLLGHRHDAIEIHQMFDVYVQSSDSEGVPNAVLESMALETPIVATSVGGTAEVLEHEVHGLLVPPRNPRALAAAIERAEAAPIETRARVIRARARVENELSFDARMAALELIYEEALQCA